MNIEEKQLKEILLGQNYVTAEDIKKAEDFIAGSGKETGVIDYLLNNGLLTKDLLGQAVAEAFGVPYADLNSNQPGQDQIRIIPEDIAQKLRIVLFTQEGEYLMIATDNPATPNLAETLESIFSGNKIIIAYSLPEDIDTAFLHYRKTLETRFSKIIQEEKRVAPEILEEIFNDAITLRASDIHFEPQGEEIVVRFRIDGVLHESGRIPYKYYENILNRIKVQSRLRIDEHFSAQDGSMRHEKDGGIFDLRVSIIPTVEGEKVVFRIAASYVKGFDLGTLGLSEQHQAVLEQASRKPFGMVMVVGPTGSGKTTTLYSVLKLLNRPEVNITTIEDPVEYKIKGINQIQINPQTGLTFAKGLRSIVRQDPDIVLVGEIRDKETVNIAVNAALTGHLMLSTFHSNDAATAIPRLLDMGTEPFLLASTLEVILAQRLVRRICENCKQSVEVSIQDVAKILPKPERFIKGKKITFYQGKGCNACGYSGFHGRSAIFEFIQISSKIKNSILKNPSSEEIWKLARDEGSTSLFEDGITKVVNGVTTLEELLRVAEPPKQ